MSLLFDVLFASVARSTHHKLALDALGQLRCAAAGRWRDLFLVHHASYLAGAKAPDDKFKDFKNHVLHVQEKYWGGAATAAQTWYAMTVGHLRNADWAQAAYAAGVLSHYVSDPLMPLHTGQSEAEGAVHRALEWSVTRCYSQLREIIQYDLGGFPEVAVSTGADWLGDLIREGARFANTYYDVLIDHYDLATGVKDPPRGLDPTSRQAIARCLGHAIVAWARVLDRALTEAAVQPPVVSLGLPAVVAAIRVPIRMVTSKLADHRDRQLVEAIYREVQATGKAVETLPEDDRTVRQMHAAEVLRVPLSRLDAELPRPAGQKFGIAATLPAVAPATRPTPKTTLSPESDHVPGRRCFLQRTSPIVDAPSIGPKTADRLHSVGINTVACLLAARPEELAARLATRHITTSTLRAWQSQAALVCDVAGLRGHDAQLAVAAGVVDVKALAAANPARLHAAVVDVAESAEGQRILRGSAAPNLEEVTAWIRAASRAVPSRAA